MHVLHILKGLVDWQTPLAAALLFVPLERLFPVHRQRMLREGWKADGAYILVNTLIYRVFFTLIVTAVLFARKTGPFVWTAGYLSQQPLWLQAIEAVIVGDFCLYWAHRALHVNPFLWRFHAVHHAIRELDWAAAYHSHFIDELILSGAAFGSVYLLGFSPAAIAIYGLIYAAVSLAVHANLRCSIGPLARFISSPAFHRWHHSNELDARDRNFAAIISLWDFAFGTAFFPEARTPMIYGTDHPIPLTYADQLLYPFRRKTRRLAAEPAVPA